MAPNTINPRLQAQEVCCGVSPINNMTLEQRLSDLYSRAVDINAVSKAIKSRLFGEEPENECSKTSLYSVENTIIEVNYILDEISTRLRCLNDRI